MRHLFILFLVIISVSCKNETKSETELSNSNEVTEDQGDGLSSFKGEFVYYADAAVMKVNGEMYGVVINEKMHELDKMAEPYQQDYTDYVTAEVKGKLIEKPANEEGWPYRIDIKEIISVEKSQENKDDTIILE